MLERDIRLVRIIRKKIHGNNKYFVQLSVEGAPAVKHAADGSLLHPIKDASIGIYIDASTLTIATSEDEIHTIDISSEDPKTIERSRRISELKSYMAHSRNISHTETNNYIRAREQLSDLYRIEAEQRKIRAYSIANEVLSYGSDICVNDYQFAYVQSHSGYSRNPDRGSKKIRDNAPAQILRILDNKLVAAGKEPVKRVKIRIDRTIPDYREQAAKRLYELTL